MKQIEFERGIAGGVRLHVLPTDQFKTFSISVYMGRLLAESTVTPTALMPFVLRRGTGRLPETRLFREKLDEMYGAGFGFDIYKRGDYQIVQFRMDIIQDSFVESRESLLEQAIAFLGDTITNPLKEQGGFREKYVDAEKETLRKKLESIVNDKIRYASERCLEEMCEGEPYRLHPLGRTQDLDKILPQSLYEQYESWLSEAPVDIYVTGNTSLKEVEKLARKFFRFKPNTPQTYNRPKLFQKQEPAKTVIERLDVNQGKLNMGLRIPVTYSDDQYPAALMYNGILGGYPHSKLFTNVREKASLAYYAASRFDGHKGILTIQSGIEIGNFDKAVRIIKEQLEIMKQGNIHDTELLQTKAMIVNQLREMQDSAFDIVAFDFNAVLSGKERSVSELINSIEDIQIADIRAVAEEVQLDTIYFLRDRKGDQA
ncbi:pitrilysin family protein [Paenibacillus larvae]